MPPSARRPASRSAAHRSLDGSGSLSSSGGNVVAVNPDLTVGSGLIFSAVGGTVTFNAKGAAMTVGRKR